MKFATKIVAEPVVVAEPVKKVWGRKKELVVKHPVRKPKREAFHREYERELTFMDGERVLYIWEFTEYAKPTPLTPQPRLLEKRYKLEGRDRMFLPTCPVVWMVDMEVRMQAYMDFQAWVAAEPKGESK